MAANNLEVVGLDFNTIKSNFKTYLQNNTQFKDIDFEGSNISVLMDLLAYNTYLNSFYTNMVASEMFLDSAQLKESVISHAKELNYTPRSFRSAKATIKIDITPTSSVETVVIPKNTTFTTRVGSNTYSFSTAEAVVITTANNGVYSATADVYEGDITTETFVVNRANEQQRFTLSNATVDTTSIDVTVYEDNGTVSLPYTQTSSLFGVTSTSQVFFVQATSNQQYEIFFGDSTFGRRPKDGATVVIVYRSASGELPNGASAFVNDGSIDGHSAVEVSTVSGAAGGTVAETIESIRFNAPRNYQTQDRAVTSSDYIALLKSNFADIRAVSVYGGETVVPPKFGRVIISVDTTSGDGASDARKAEYARFLETRKPVTASVEFVDPEFTNVRVRSTVYYNANLTTKTAKDIEIIARAAISTYDQDSLRDYNKTLYYSSLVTAITNSDPSILSNDTSLEVLRSFTPTINLAQNHLIDTGLVLATEVGIPLDDAEAHYGHTIVSTPFTYLNTRSILVDDTLGNLYIAAYSITNSITITTPIGTVDYNNGIITIKELQVTAFEGTGITLTIRTQAKDIPGLRNTILQISDADTRVSVVGIRA